MSRDNFWPTMAAAAAFCMLAVGVVVHMTPRSEPAGLGSGPVANEQYRQWQARLNEQKKRAEADEASSDLQEEYDKEISRGGVVWNKSSRNCYYVARVQTYYNYLTFMPYGTVPCCTVKDQLAPTVRDEACPSGASTPAVSQ